MKLRLKSIKKVSFEKSRCIQVANPNGLYVTDDYIITHNSTLTVCMNLYITVLFSLMWAPFKYFGLAPSSIFTQVYAAVSQKKASELLLEPMINILSQTPYFVRCRTSQEVLEAQRSTDTPETLAWTSSSPTSVLSFQNGANYKLISKAGGLLGQNIITGSFTEFSFFYDEGWALDLKTPILMEDKSIKEMKDVKVGDKLYHPEGKENIVIDIPYEKLSDQFEITLDNGKTIKCHRNHIWKVSYRKDNNGKPIYELVTTQFMIDHPELEFDIPEI